MWSNVPISLGHDARTIRSVGKEDNISMKKPVLKNNSTLKKLWGKLTLCTLWDIHNIIIFDISDSYIYPVLWIVVCT